MSSLLNIPVEMSEISFHTFEDPNTWQQTMTDEAAQADAFEKMLTTYFSHPKVTALLLWGFGEYCSCHCVYAVTNSVVSRLQSQLRISLAARLGVVQVHQNATAGLCPRHIDSFCNPHFATSLSYELTVSS